MKIGIDYLNRVNTALKVKRFNNDMIMLHNGI